MPNCSFDVVKRDMILHNKPKPPFSIKLLSLESMYIHVPNLKRIEKPRL